MKKCRAGSHVHRKLQYSAANILVYSLRTLNGGSRTRSHMGVITSKLNEMNRFFSILCVCVLTTHNSSKITVSNEINYSSNENNLMVVTGLSTRKAENHCRTDSLPLPPVHWDDKQATTSTLLSHGFWGSVLQSSCLYTSASSL